MSSTTSPSRRADPRSPAGPDARPGAKRRRHIRWGRIPGRLILALCFLFGAAALAAAVLPFSTTTTDGVRLQCGPAVFEVLMPADPAFDDIPENVGCAAPAKTRLIVAGGVVVGVVLVAGFTERRTRRGNNRRDTRWLTAPTRRRARRRTRRAAAARSATGSPAAVRRSSAAAPPSIDPT